MYVCMEVSGYGRMKVWPCDMVYGFVDVWMSSWMDVWMYVCFVV